MTDITYDQLLRTAAKNLSLCETPMLDARILLMAVTGFEEADLIANASQSVPAEIVQHFEDLIARRQLHEPVAYIVGYKDFWQDRYRVTPDVLIPRADSECIVETVLSLRPPETNADISIVDAGTGSGCLLGALLTMYPLASGLGIDRSMKAIDIAKTNMRSLGIADRARILCGSWFESIDGPIDVIVTNPPYIPEAEYNGLAKEIVDYEPKTALTSENDGKADYQQILSQSGHVIAPDGLIVIEIGDGHSVFLMDIAQEMFPKCSINCHNDLNGRPRALSIDFSSIEKIS